MSKEGSIVVGNMTIRCDDPQLFALIYGESAEMRKELEDEMRRAKRGSYPSREGGEPENDNTIFAYEVEPTDEEDIIGPPEDPIVQAIISGFNEDSEGLEEDEEIGEPKEGSSEFVSKWGGHFPKNSVNYGAGNLTKGIGYMRYENKGVVYMIADSPGVLENGSLLDISGTDEETALRRIHKLYFDKAIPEDYREDFLVHVIEEIDRDGMDILSNIAFQYYLKEEVNAMKKEVMYAKAFLNEEETYAKSIENEAEYMEQRDALQKIMDLSDEENESRNKPNPEIEDEDMIYC